MADTELKIKVKKDSDELVKLRSELKDATNEFLKLKASGTASAQEIDKAGQKVRFMSANLKTATNSVKELTSSNKLGARSWLEMGENITVVTAGLSIIIGKFKQFAVESVKAFNEQEKSLIQLKALTGDNEQQYKSFVAFATANQDKWGIPDEQTQSLIAFGLAQGRSESQIKKNVEAARILALVMNTDVDTAYRQIDATFEGNVKSLGRMEKDFKGLSEEQLKNGGAVDLIMSKYGKLGDIQDSNIVKTQKLTAAWEETKETIGGVIVEGLSPLGESLTTVGLKGQDFIGIIAKSALGLNTLFSVLGHVKKTVNDFSGSIDGLVKSIFSLNSSNSAFNQFVSSIGTGLVGLKNDLLDILGLMNSISNAAIDPTAKSGTRFGGKTKENEANAPTRFTGNTGTGSKTEKEKELNFLEQLRKKIADLTADMQSLNTQLATENIAEFEKLAIQDELIKKQKELNELKRVNMGLSGIEKSGTAGFNPALITGSFRGTANSSNQFSQGDLDTQEEIARIDEMRLSYANQINESFMQMLQTTGLMNTEFGRIVAMIQSILNAGSSLFSMGEGIFGLITSFIPGGGAIQGIASIAGGSLPTLGAGGGSGMSFNPNIIIQGDTTRYGAYKLVQEGNNMIAEQGTRVI